MEPGSHLDPAPSRDPVPLPRHARLVCPCDATDAGPGSRCRYVYKCRALTVTITQTGDPPGETRQHIRSQWFITWAAMDSNGPRTPALTGRVVDRGARRDPRRPTVLVRLTAATLGLTASPPRDRAGPADPTATPGKPHRRPLWPHTEIHLHPRQVTERP
jgi:hypothetical protein